MEKGHGSLASRLYEKLVCFMIKIVYFILSTSQIPSHIAFIMDGNRRYARKCKMIEREGHVSGYSALMNILYYCYEFGVKYITVYAFSIDNFKRGPENVQTLMELMKDRINDLIREDSMVNQYGVRVCFVGNLKLLDESVRLAAEKLMSLTAMNSKVVMSICIAYTSTDEIVHAAENSCKEKLNLMNMSSGLGENKEEEKPMNRVDIGNYLYTVGVPEPDIIMRSSGETRLSNFLLWQSTHTYLCTPSALWPEIGFRHLVWAILNFQRVCLYLDKKRKQL